MAKNHKYQNNSAIQFLASKVEVQVFRRFSRIVGMIYFWVFLSFLLSISSGLAQTLEPEIINLCDPEHHARRLTKIQEVDRKILDLQARQVLNKGNLLDLTLRRSALQNILRNVGKHTDAEAQEYSRIPGQISELRLDQAEIDWLLAGQNRLRARLACLPDTDA